MEKVSNTIKTIGKYIYWKNIGLLICIISAFVVTAAFFENIMTFAGTIIQNYNKFVVYTIVGTAAIGSTHAILKRTKEDNAFFLKFINNAFLAAVFTSITYGIIINACLALLYIVLYDIKFIENYPNIDKITTGIALILLLVASLAGLLKMVWEICKPPETTVTITSQNIEN